MANPSQTQSSQWVSFANQAGQNLTNYTQQNPLSPVNVGQNNASSVPAWLQPNMSELQQQYADIPSEYKQVLAPLQNAYNASINYNTTLGEQSANSAAQQYSTSAQQQGGNREAAGVVRAQALLPVFQQNTQARQQLAGTEASYQSQAIGLQASIANQLASLRTSYANTLAQYLTQQRGQNISEAEFNQSNSLAASNSVLSNASTLSKLGGGSGIIPVNGIGAGQVNPVGSAGYTSFNSAGGIF
jgi:hypothetical protein